ncbi:MAG: hypothetical protein ACXW3G_10080 [Rhodoplanes sp.]
MIELVMSPSPADAARDESIKTNDIDFSAGGIQAGFLHGLAI